MESRNRFTYCISIGIIILIVLGLADISIGETGLSDPTVIWKLRLPRILTAILAGAAMAVSGAQMQSIFRNPLADPHIMGISAGSGLGAAIVTISFASIGSSAISGIGIASGAFLGAALTSILTIIAASKIHNGTTLLIFGVMLGFIFSAITSIIEYSSNQESLKLFYSWSAGSFTGNGITEIAILASALIIGTLIAIAGNKGLDIIMFSDEYASMSGADVRKIRMSAMLSSCILTGAVTAFCGPLGFVGIVSPHIARKLLRSSSNLHVLPTSIVVGGSISLLADLISQIAGIPLPVGSTIALIGIPIILTILFRGKDNTFEQ
jgi:iron complex transport system permease protein